MNCQQVVAESINNLTFLFKLKSHELIDTPSYNTGGIDKS